MCNHEEVIPERDIDILRDTVYEERGFKEELLQELERFNKFIKEASKRLEYAIEAEQYPNNAIQDILHVIELAPSKIERSDIVELLHNCRDMRRTAKDELEVAELWANYVKSNADTFRLLDNLIGSIRKVIERQPTRMYNFKTNIIGEQGTWLEKEEEPQPQPNDPIYEQLSFLDEI